MASYTEIDCASALTKVNGRFPFKWDMNIYRGCQHGCKYCYAIYSHEYMGSKNGYFEDIYIKTNIVDRLEEQLRKRSWKKEVINIGGVTDSYQSVEKKYRLMPDVLRLMIKYKNPCIISTKSDLILRDYDLIDELSRLTYVNIATTITCTDESIRKKIEPNGAESAKRFEVIRQFSKTNCSTGVHFMPIIPLITDNRENIMSIYEMAKDCGAEYVLPGMLYLRGRTRDIFLEFIAREYPQKAMMIVEIFKDKELKNEYRKKLYSMINEAKRTYKVSGDYMARMKLDVKKENVVQLSLFD